MKPKRARLLTPAEYRHHSAQRTSKLAGLLPEQQGPQAGRNCNPSNGQLSRAIERPMPAHTLGPNSSNGDLNQQSLSEQNSSVPSQPFVCSGCEKPIKRDKFLLKACDKYWHENCLRCDRCKSRLGELGSTLFCKSNMNLCRQDYLELFGEKGVCSVCDKLIFPSEMVMRARENTYHLDCFACQLCNQRFCVGDRFYLCENKVVCEYDYEEHILPIQRSLSITNGELHHHQPHHQHLQPMGTDVQSGTMFVPFSSSSSIIGNNNNNNNNNNNQLQQQQHHLVAAPSVPQANSLGLVESEPPLQLETKNQLAEVVARSVAAPQTAILSTTPSTSTLPITLGPRDGSHGLIPIRAEPAAEARQPAALERKPDTDGRVRDLGACK